MSGFIKAWNAYLCAMHGHVVDGVGTSTNWSSNVLWAKTCRRCGAKVRG